MDWLWKGKDEVIFETSRDRKRREKARNIKWFVLAAVILALLAVILVMKQYDFRLNGGSSKSGEETSAEEMTREEVKYATGKATFMVYCTGKEDKEITFLYLIRADMDEDFVKVHPLPVDEDILTFSGLKGNEKGNATRCYNIGGEGMLREACENYLGVKIDKFLGCTEDNFENIAVNFSNIKINVPATVNLYKNDDRETLAAGVQEISDRALYKYMTYDGFETKQAKLEAQGLSMKLMIEQFIDDNFVKNAAVIFSRIINMAQSDISVIDLQNNIKALKYMANENSDFECSSVISKDEFISCITGG